MVAQHAGSETSCGICVSITVIKYARIIIYMKEKFAFFIVWETIVQGQPCCIQLGSTAHHGDKALGKMVCVPQG